MRDLSCLFIAKAGVCGGAIAERRLARENLSRACDRLGKVRLQCNLIWIGSYCAGCFGSQRRK